MITRKRGRCSSSGAAAVCSSPPRDRDHGCTPDAEAGAPKHTSPGSDANDWGLEDLFNSDVDWAFDNDLLSPFADVGVQDLNAEDETDRASSVTFSYSRGSAERQKFQDLSGRIINKNAMAARMNRLKKKQYLSGLEQRVGSLTSENRLLKQENNSLNKRVEELESETRYLRAVLANESMLAQLLSRLSGVNGMKFSSSLFQESNESDHDYALPRKRVKVEDKDAPGGICLHVDKDHVSVEFCTKCAESASSSHKM